LPAPVSPTWGRDPEELEELDGWSYGASSVSRFGVDQWHRVEPDGLTELERWPESPAGPAMWRVFLIATDPLRFTYFTNDPSLTPDEARNWATEQRKDYTAR
jgi:hypothetical protein